MGSILTNGVFLPAEGERNCYEGLAANWVALDGVIGGYGAHAANLTIHVTAADKEAWNGKADASALTAHTGDTTIHVTAADKEAWNGKADASALTAHTGDTTIHVTAEDKAKWDAVMGKADDANVMHLTGDESSTGKKIFGDMATFRGSYLGSEPSISFRTCAEFLSCFDTKDKSGIFLSKFRSNAAQGAMSGSDVSFITMDVLENGERTNAILRFNLSAWSGNTPGTFSLYPKASMTSNLGITSNKWTRINGLSPSALSLPDLTAGVDISGYLSNAGTTTPSEYTPTVDGWLVLAISADSPAFIRVFSSSGIDTTAYSERNELGSTSGGTYTRYAALTVPCRQNDKQNIIIMPSTMGIVKAMFYPCTGNV